MSELKNKVCMFLLTEASLSLLAIYMYILFVVWEKASAFFQSWQWFDIAVIQMTAMLPATTSPWSWKCILRIKKYKHKKIKVLRPCWYYGGKRMASSLTSSSPNEGSLDLFEVLALNIEIIIWSFWLQWTGESAPSCKDKSVIWIGLG